MANNKEKGIKGFFKKRIENETKKEDNEPVNIQPDNTNELPREIQLGEDSSVYGLWKCWSGNKEHKYNPLEYIFDELYELYEASKTEPSEKVEANIEEIQLLIRDIILKSEELYCEIPENEKEKAILDESMEDFSSKELDAEMRFSDLSAFGGINKLDDIVEFEMFMDDEDEEEEDKLYNTAKKVLTGNGENNDTTTDAYIYIRVSSDNMHAWVFIFPPRNGGKEISVDMLKNALDEKKIVYGTDNNMIVKIAEKKLYFKLIRIARGMECIDGKDGEIIDLVPRESEVKIKESDDGKIDFKELNLIRSIHKGDTICKIVPPVEPKSGMDVYGNEVKGYVGKMPPIPRGKNTQISEDGTTLEALIDGHISFDKGAFHIQNLLTIPGDVDISVGNINFAGDVMIKGKVREGFSVKSDGNITIRGNVEAGAIIKAGGNISIERGVNGGARGLIEAKGSVKIKYIENCKVCAGEKIETEVIIDSEIECDDTLLVTRGKGTIIGGKMTVGKLIEAKIIGNEKNSSRTTEIVLGCMPNMIKQRNLLKEKIEETRKGLEKLLINIRYIESLGENIDATRKMLLNQLRIQVPLRQMEKKKYDKMLEKANKLIDNIDFCKIRVGVVYPITTIKIGGETKVIHEVTKGFSLSSVDIVKKN